MIAAAEQIQAREAAIAADIRAGVAIDKAMHDARLAGQTRPGNATTSDIPTATDEENAQ